MNAKNFLCSLALGVVFVASPAVAQQPAASAPKMSAAERMASDATAATLEHQSRSQIEQLFARLCPGRCELVEVGVEMGRPEPVGEVTPGFEAVAGPSFLAEPKAINATILLDSKLPRNFQSNIPRMIRYRLASLAPTVNVRPEVLDFPEPQLEPMPPFMPEPPRRGWEPAPMPELPEPLIEPVPEPVMEPEPAVEPTLWDRLGPFLEALAPWIGPIIMMLVLFGLMLALIRRLNETQRVATGADSEGRKRKDEEVDVEALGNELRTSRALRNRVLRRWLDEDPEGVSRLVRLLGPELLADLKSDPGLVQTLARVSELVAIETDPLSAEERARVANEAQARMVSAKVLLDENGLTMDWEFLEGIGVANLRRIMQSCSSNEKVYVMGQLPPALRSSYLESLDGAERRELVLNTSAEVFGKQDAIALAARLRKAADEVSHIGREADGQAVLVLDMLRALPLDDQEGMLRELKAKRPEVAEVVLSRFMLETTIMLIPGEVLADAIHRTSVEALSSFLRGARPDVRDHVLMAAPGTKRQAVATELSLEVPVGRTEFLDARQRFLDALRELLRRDGHDLTRINARALMSTKINPVPQDEMSGG